MKHNANFKSKTYLLSSVVRFFCIYIFYIKLTYVVSVMVVMKQKIN